MDTKIFASIIDDATKAQIQNLSTSEAYKDSVIRIMPDCHVGKGCTIGSVIRYTDKVIPSTVGVDIGCGMLVVELGNIDIDLERLDEVIHTYLPSGYNIHPKPLGYFTSFQQYNAPIPEEKDDYIQCSVGTLGGGNHFIEIDEDDDKNKYLVIHSGSRNLGVMICNYWQEKAYSNLSKNLTQAKELIEKLKAEGREKEIQSTLKALKTSNIKKEEAYLEGKDLELYLQDMSLCQFYAYLNRKHIARIICRNMGWTLFKYDSFETIHNYIDVPDKIIRKGAVSAKAGKKLIIPLNMKDGSLICIGKGNPDWLDSAPHGAGRIMSRAQATKDLKIEDFQKSMEGIYTTSVCEETIDEAPMVYKNKWQIMQDIVPTVHILKVIKPIYNFKAKS